MPLADPPPCLQSRTTIEVNDSTNANFSEYDMRRRISWRTASASGLVSLIRDSGSIDSKALLAVHWYIRKRSVFSLVIRSRIVTECTSRFFVSNSWLHIRHMKLSGEVSQGNSSRFDGRVLCLVRPGPRYQPGFALTGCHRVQIGLR